jgi:hypothetical protein
MLSGRIRVQPREASLAIDAIYDAGWNSCRADTRTIAERPGKQPANVAPDGDPKGARSAAAQPLPRQSAAESRKY